jgi:hypothetical protein
MVDGQFIMRNRQVLTMDEDSIITEAGKVGRRSGTRCWKQALFRCRADRAGSDNHAGLISSAISHGPQEFVKISRILEVAKIYSLTALELMAKATT